MYYYEARYYDALMGRFISVDPVYLSIGNSGETKSRTGLSQQKFIRNPQKLNAYSYVANNPLRYIDPNGETLWNVVTGEQTWDNYVIETGEAAEYLYQNSATAKTMMDHPIGTGVAVGVGSGLTLVGSSYLAGVGYTGLGIGAETTATIGTAGTQVNKVIDYTQKFGQDFGSKMNSVSSFFQKQGVKVSEHALIRTIQRTPRGVTPEKVVDTFRNGTKYLDIKYNNISYFKDGVRVATDTTNKIITVVTQDKIDISRFKLIK